MIRYLSAKSEEDYSGATVWEPPLPRGSPQRMAEDQSHGFLGHRGSNRTPVENTIEDIAP